MTRKSDKWCKVGVLSNHAKFQSPSWSGSSYKLLQAGAELGQAQYKLGLIFCRYGFATLELHLGFSALLKIWQVLACKMEPRSGIIFGQNRPDPADPTRPPNGLVWKCPSSASNTCLNVVRCPHYSLNIRPGDNCHGWSPTIDRMVTTNPRMVTYRKKIYYSLRIWHLDWTHKTKTRW